MIVFIFFMCIKHVFINYWNDYEHSILIMFLTLFLNRELERYGGKNVIVISAIFMLSLLAALKHTKSNKNLNEIIVLEHFLFGY